MTPRQILVRYAPTTTWRADKALDRAKLRRALRKTRAELAVERAICTVLRRQVAALTAERDALAVHWGLAVDQRDRAREIAAASVLEPGPGWDELTAERDRLRSLVNYFARPPGAPVFSPEDEAIVGAWLDGERPA